MSPSTNIGAKRTETKKGMATKTAAEAERVRESEMARGRGSETASEREEGGTQCLCLFSRVGRAVGAARVTSVRMGGWREGVRKEE